MGKLLLGTLSGPPGPQGIPGVTGPWVPGDSGLLAANGDPWLAQGSRILTAGVLYLMKMRIRSAITASKINFGVAIAGAGSSSGSYVGFYSSAGVLLTGSADVASSYLLSTGAKSPSVTTPQALTSASWVWSAILVNLATTQPTLVTGLQTPNSFSNFGETAQTARFGSYGTAQTALPGSLVLANISFSNGSYWNGVS